MFLSYFVACVVPPRDAAHVRSTVQLLMRLFLFLDYNTLYRYSGGRQDLKSMLEHISRAVVANLDAEWDTGSTLVALLQQVKHHLGLVQSKSIASASTASSSSSGTLQVPGKANVSPPLLPSSLPDAYRSSNFARLRALVAEGLSQLSAAHRELWHGRRQQLQLAKEEARQHLHRVEREGLFLDRILFHRKVLSFSRIVAIPCRLQLPGVIQARLTGQEHSLEDLMSPLPFTKTSSGDDSSQTRQIRFGSSTSVNGDVPAAKSSSSTAGPLFYCGSVDTFISEFMEYAHSLRRNVTIAAEILHKFLNVAKKRCEQDATFTPEVMVPVMRHWCLAHCNGAPSRRLSAPWS